MTYWIVISLMVLLVEMTEGRLNLGSLNGGGFLNPTELACEGYPIVLRCPGTDVIEVIEAQYGRKNTETCAISPNLMRNTNCRSPQATDIMSERCNNKTQCMLSVSSDVLPDPCPGTHKYLEVSFRCLKYMFGCPGSLVGIGTNVSMETSMREEAGSWSKDAIYNPGHVFYLAKGGQSVQEYLSTDNFVGEADPVNIYDLPYPVQGTSFVVYDGNMYYVKAQSRQLIKYSVLARLRIKQGSLPGVSNTPKGVNDNLIQLAVDENGLWAIYTSSADDGMIMISRINRDSLQREKTWRTTFLKRSSLHTYMICGILYVVGSRTGEVEYVYNTNTSPGTGKSVSIGFERNRPLSPSDPGRISGRMTSSSRRMFPSSFISTSRTFRSYKFTSVLYNPRDRLLYAWESTSGRAVYYNLHFGSTNPADAGKPTTTSTTATTGFASSTAPHKHNVDKPLIPTSPAKPSPTDPRIPGHMCPKMHRSGMNWPMTKVGEEAMLPCPSSNGEIARWACGRERISLKPVWTETGPDMSHCITWVGDIKSRLENGDTDPDAAANVLARRLTITSQSADSMDSSIVVEASRLLKTITFSVSGSVIPLTRTQAQRLTEGLATAVQVLTTGDHWNGMSVDERHETINNIMSSMEEGGLLFAKTISSRMRSTLNADYESETITKPGFVMRVNVQSPDGGTELIFPDNVQAKDRVVVPGDSLASVAKQGVATSVVVLYDNLGELADADLAEAVEAEEWKLDSRVVSVVVGEIGHGGDLASPVRITLESKQKSSQPRKCVYWKYSQRVGQWSNDGCQVANINQSHTECSCDHLTSFAVLVDVAGATGASWNHVLELHIVTIVGISISLLFLALCIVTFSAFRNIQSDRNTIHKHLCICLFIAELVFLTGINRTGSPLPCSVVAGLLHYFFLAAFMWLALEGFQLYVMLMEVFEERSRWKWYYLTGYGVPAVIVGVSVAVDSSGYGSLHACWLRVDSGFIWSFVGPVCAVILCNLFFLFITVMKLFKHTMTFTDTSRVNWLKASVRGTSALLFLMGVTWAFGILWIWGESQIMAYLFCVFNAFQGIYIFIFYCILQKKIRSEYSRCMPRLFCCRKKSNDSYMSNSMSFSKQYTSARYSASHAATSQSQLRRMWNDTLVNPSQQAPMPPQDTLPNREPPRGSRISHNDVHQVASTSQLTRHPGSQHKIISRDNTAPVISDHENEVFLSRSREELTDQIPEDAYDHLQRHCHPDCDPSGQYTECKHAHHTRYSGGFPMPSRPQGRSQTMNPIKPIANRTRNPDKEEVDLHRCHDFQRATTLSNAVPATMGYERRPSTPTRRFSQPVKAGNASDVCPYHAMPGSEQSRLLPPPTTSAYRLYNEAEDKINARPGKDAVHPAHRLQRRRSMTSSESDDPIVNDFSASSSTGSKPSSLTGTIGMRPAVPPNTMHANHVRDYNARHLDNYPTTYRDAADLEVQQLTGPDHSLCHDACGHGGCCKESQRDSAFYQSMPDLNSSPTATHSLDSSGCSPAGIGGAGPLYIHRPVKSMDASEPRYVTAPTTGDFQSLRMHPQRNDHSDPNTLVKSHDDTQHQGYPQGREFTQQNYPTNSNEQSAQPRSHGNFYEVPLDASGRMMTSL